MEKAHKNALYYKQVGNKEWEINLVFDLSTGGSNGSGEYIFTLPNSLSFDLTYPGQDAYQGGIGVDSWANAQHTLPATGLITNLAEGGQVYPVIWTARTFRVLTTTYLTSNIRFWGSGFYNLGGQINMKFSFIST